MGQLQDVLNQPQFQAPTRPKYEWVKYKYIKTLGAGAFGEVYLVRDARTAKRHALKKIKCSSNDDLSSVTQELKSMTKVSHPNIMRLLETLCKEKDHFYAEIYMIFEYCSGGTLTDRLEQQPSSEALNRKWMQQLTEAVTHIHAFALVHRDLKPDNVLLDANNNIKVGDFGLARDFVAAKRDDETWENYYMTAACGTLFYMAPEVFEGHYTDKADVFALGVLLYAIEERQCFDINEVKCYGIFLRLSDEDFAPLGLQMHIDKKGLRVPFNKCRPKIAQIIGSALLFDQKKRADAATINGKLKEC